MKKEQKEIKVIVNGEIDLREMPNELFNLLIVALSEEIDKVKNSNGKEM